MKKLILISIMFIGLSTSAQIIYQPTFFGGSYLMDGQYVGETQFKSMLLKNPMAYNMWNEGTANLTTGYIVLYSSSAILGWGIGTSLGNSIVIGNKIVNKKILNLNELIGRIFLNDQEIYHNKASSILNNPLNALKWYFDKIIELNKVIKKGNKVSLGSITPLIWISEPTKIRASIDNIGDCEITFVK